MKKGFTLAEVLTTLMVIGVVAVLTIPSMLQSYKKMQIENTLKKTAASLSNAITMAVATTGEQVKDWHIDDVEEKNKVQDAGEDYFIKYLAPHMKVAKYLYPADYWERKNAEGEELSDVTATILLHDGVALEPFWQDTYSENLGYASILVDVNGEKGPNSYGRDLFFLNIFENSDGSINVGAYPVGSQKDSPEERATIKNLCYNDPNWGMLGYWCTGVIIGNGYKIPKDYKWLK